MKIPEIGVQSSQVLDDCTLEFEHAGRTYLVVEPPYGPRIDACLAWLATGPLPAKERDAARAEVLAKAECPTLAHLTLGADVMEQLTTDRVPRSLVAHWGLIALVAWGQGMYAVPRYLARIALRRAADSGGEASGEAKPARRSRSTSGRSSASASRTKTGSTRTTGSRPS